MTESQAIVNGVAAIVSDYTADVAAMQGTPPFGGDDAAPVSAAQDNSAVVLGTLLDTLTGKAGIFVAGQTAGPVAAALRSLGPGSIRSPSPSST